MADVTASPNITLTITGQDETGLSADLLSFLVERDMFQPDMAAVVLKNEGGLYSAIPIGAEVEIKIGDRGGGKQQTSIYKGEVIGLEPIYKGGEKTRIVIRAMNRFHRLLRLRKSVTFSELTDSDILNKIVGDAGLRLEWQHDTKITYKHVYQHNQTDMEFLRTRAARVGCHVWCVDRTLHVKQPDLQQQPSVIFSTSLAGGDSERATLKSFTPRLSSAHILTKVTVKGWNPETKELIVGTSSAQASKLGGKNAASAVSGAASFGGEETFTVDHPIWSQEEAVALAKARLVDLSLSYITGECELTGDPKRTLGEVVAIFVNREQGTRDNDPFNGRYYVMGVTHRYASSAKGPDAGYSTVLRLARDAQLKVSDDERALSALEDAE